MEIKYIKSAARVLNRHCVNKRGFSLQFGAFHATCLPGMTLLYLPCDMLKLMLIGLTFLRPGLTFLRPGLRKVRPVVLLSHRHLGISQLSVSIHSSLSPYL